MNTEAIPAPVTESTSPHVDLKFFSTKSRPHSAERIQWVSPSPPLFDVSHSGVPMGIITGTAGSQAAPLPSATFALKVDSADDCFTVYDGPTGIFGAGSTLGEAFSDFATAAVEHRDVLERQQLLSPPLEEQLVYLRQRLPR